MPVTAALIVGGASLASGYMGSKSAEHAADLQAGAARDATALQKAMFDTQNAQQAPYRSAGYGALNKINSMMGSPYIKYDYQGNPIMPKASTASGVDGIAGGVAPVRNLTATGNTPIGAIANAAQQLGPFINSAATDTQTPTEQAAESDYLTHQFNAEDFKNGIDPGFAWRLKMGQDQASRQANLGGGAISGNALAGLQDYTQGQASQEYGNAFNRYQTQRSNIYNTLASIAGLGQTSLGQTTNAASNAASGMANSIMNAGSAQAGGIVGSANAISGGLQGAGNAYMLSNLLKPQTSTNYNLNSGGGSSSFSPNLESMGGGQGIQLRT